MQWDLPPACRLGGEGRVSFSRLWRVCSVEGMVQKPWLCRRQEEGQRLVAQDRSQRTFKMHEGTLSGPRLRRDKLRPEVPEDGASGGSI